MEQKNRINFVMVAMAVLASSAFAQLPERRTDLDWFLKWHGQKTAIGVISQGKALDGYHFNGKHNRIQEAPWNAVQTLLGAYFVSTVDGLVATASFEGHQDRLIAAQCRAVLSMLSSQQSLYELHVVYQLDDWRPEDKFWQNVSLQPVVVRSIPQIKGVREAKIREFLGMKVIPLRKVDNCETLGSESKMFVLGQEYSDGFEIAWEYDKSPIILKKQIEMLKTSGLLTREDILEVDAVIQLFEEGLSGTQLSTAWDS